MMTARLLIACLPAAWPWSYGSCACAGVRWKGLPLPTSGSRGTAPSCSWSCCVALGLSRDTVRSLGSLRGLLEFVACEEVLELAVALRTKIECLALGRNLCNARGRLDDRLAAVTLNCFESTHRRSLTCIQHKPSRWWPLEVLGVPRP